MAISTVLSFLGGLTLENNSTQVRHKEGWLLPCMLFTSINVSTLTTLLGTSGYSSNPCCVAAPPLSRSAFTRVFGFDAACLPVSAL